MESVNGFSFRFWKWFTWVEASIILPMLCMNYLCSSRFVVSLDELSLSRFACHEWVSRALASPSLAQNSGSSPGFVVEEIFF